MTKVGVREVAESKDVRVINAQKIMDVFIAKGVCTKKEIAASTGLSLGTCTNLLKILEEQKKIMRITDSDSTGGRKAKRYQLVDDKDYYAFVYQKDNSQHVLEVINLRGQTVETFTLALQKAVVEDIHHLLEMMNARYPQVKKVVISISAEKAKAEVDLPLRLMSQYPFKVEMDCENNYVLSGYATKLETIPESMALMYQVGEQTSPCSLLVNGSIIHGFSHYAGSLSCLFEDGSAKTIKAKKGIFVKKIVLLITTLNPEIILLATKKRSSFDKLENKLEKWIPAQHIPKLIPLENTEDLLRLGLKKACFSE